MAPLQRFHKISFFASIVAGYLHYNLPVWLTRDKRQTRRRRVGTVYARTYIDTSIPGKCHYFCCSHDWKPINRISFMENDRREYRKTIENFQTCHRKSLNTGVQLWPTATIQQYCQRLTELTKVTGRSGISARSLINKTHYACGNIDYHGNNSNNRNSNNPSNHYEIILEKRNDLP